MPVATAAVKPTRMSLRRLNINHLHRTLGKYAFALLFARLNYSSLREYCIMDFQCLCYGPSGVVLADWIQLCQQVISMKEV